MSHPDWIVCQIGAREHYSIARALHREGRLKALVTDAWSTPESLIARLPGKTGRRFAERFNLELMDAQVEHFTRSATLNEIKTLVAHRDRTDWPAITRRNRWFQEQAVARLRSTGLLERKPTVFAYSYAAGDILRAARAAGCATILGQIDPGETEEYIVADAHNRHSGIAANWVRAPQSYWRNWMEECALADRIMVNSAWSRDGLLEAGVAEEKITVVPLAYEGGRRGIRHGYPQQFDGQRPLRILFLGSVIIRKGVAELIEAARLLTDRPVTFDLVGPIQLDIDRQSIPANVRIHGAVSRGEAVSHYAAADVFLLPSLSDGFGITMLEAMAEGLPIIASRRCGDVVEHRCNGLLLNEVTPFDISEAVKSILREPEKLVQMSARAISTLELFQLDKMYARLMRIGYDI